jgi:hydrogenase nickel incorporation protein HypA/HybF
VHELSIARSLVDAVEAIARSHGAKRVVRVDCRMGCLRQVDESLLREAVIAAASGTCAADAELHVSRVGMQLRCLACPHTIVLDGWQFECPECGSSRIELSGGEECELTSVGLEVSDEDRSLEKKPSGEQRQGRGREPATAAET